jgi:TPR repeat protein
MPTGSLGAMLESERKENAPIEWTVTQKHIVLVGVASGMKFMHDHRFIHRDLKPENILLDSRYEPKISDFGLSKYVEPGQTVEQSMYGGTANFMAPEIYSGEPFGFKVDVYAFGILMYMIVTGLQPFPPVRNIAQFGVRVAEGFRPTIPDSVSPAYAALIQQCWDTSPIVRPTFEEIVSLLGDEQFLSGIDRDAFKEYQLRVCPAELIASVKHPSPGRVIDQSTNPSPADSSTINWVQGIAAELQFRPRKGEGIGRELQQAAAGFKRCADAGCATAMVEYGKYLRAGKGVPQDKTAAASYFRRAAVLGDAEGLYRLARLLRYGDGVVRNEVEAAQLFKAAGDAGHSFALNSYGEMLESGLGVEKDIPRAVEYYKMSSDQACPEGMYNLADMYHHGRHVEQNVREAVRLYTLAADAGFAEARHPLYEIWKYGEGEIPANPMRAACAAEDHAAQDEFLGLVEYADVLENGIGVTIDHATARELLAKAHSARFASEQCKYGCFLDQGKGCRRDQAKAMEYYRISAGHGNTLAMMNLGCCYHNGDGVETNLAEAANWFKRAADLGDRDGQYHYGIALREGRGIAQNPEEALLYLKRAAAKEFCPAYTDIGIIYRDGKGIERDYIEAAKWFQLAAEKKQPRGMECLALLYEKGNGVRKNIAEAKRLRKTATELGFR